MPFLVARTRHVNERLAGFELPAQPVAPGTIERDANGGTPLTIEGAEVSAVVRRNGELTVRLFNPRRAEETVSIPGRHGRVVDLRGRHLGNFVNSVVLRPHGIATLVLDE